jgi:Na+-transporting NADH:ubiquinone oxidoreductase subunit C
LPLQQARLKTLQDANVSKRKNAEILATIGIETDREQAETLYNQYISEELSLLLTVEDEKDSSAFELELNNELKKPLTNNAFHYT